MRILYPDWRHTVEDYLGYSLFNDIAMTELLWELYDEGFSPKLVLDYTKGRAGIIRTGYLGRIKGVYYK